MTIVKPWLEQLTLDKLHRLATSIGAPCSGTKSARIDGIRGAVSGIGRDVQDRNSLSLLSIDMGIKNLAFSHITASVRRVSGGPGYLYYDKPTIQAWRRIAVSESLFPTDGIVPVVGGNSKPDPVAVERAEAMKESFEPIDLARHAYTLVNYMLQAYQPNHILIERQRFRSGGQAAVQEWSLRVGVLEGMLYSVFRTLVQERNLQLTVEPMQPPRVNRYWLEGRQNGLPSTGKRLTGRDMKRAKIDLVGMMIEARKTDLRIGHGLLPFAADFVSSCKKVCRSKGAVDKSMSKLDDLADSLLQGLAWVHWQNNRRKIEALGPDTVDMTYGSLM